MGDGSITSILTQIEADFGAWNRRISEHTNAVNLNYKKKKKEKYSIQCNIHYVCTYACICIMNMNPSCVSFYLLVERAKKGRSWVFLAIFRNEITTIPTPSTSKGGGHVSHFGGPWLWIRNVNILICMCVCVLTRCAKSGHCACSTHAKCGPSTNSRHTRDLLLVLPSDSDSSSLKTQELTIKLWE